MTSTAPKETLSMNRIFGLLATLLLLLPGAALAAPGLLPVSGWLADSSGVGLQGNVSLTINLYATSSGGTALYTDTVSVDVDAGFFTAYAGSGTGGAVDLGLFADEESLWLGLAVDSDPEMTPLLQVATTPWAGFAEYAGVADDADALGGVAASEYVTTSTEADPVFGASAAASITSTDMANWAAAYGWGDHSTAGYLSAETDPVYAASAAAGITSTDTANWATAYGWGDHSTAGYITAEADGSTTNELISGVTLNGTVLEISEAGAVQTVDLATLQDGDTTYSAGTGIELSGTTFNLSTTGQIGNYAPFPSGISSGPQAASWFGIRFRIIAEPGGAGANDGRLEFSPDGGTSWGTVCDDAFDANNNQARVVCRSMGYSDGVLRDNTAVTDGTGTIYLDNFQCSDDARSLAECRVAAIGTHNCSHSEDVGVTCTP